MTPTKKCYVWSTLNKPWNSVNWAWNDCELINELVEVGSGALDPNQALQAWMEDDKNKHKKKRFIKILCEVKGYDSKTTEKCIKSGIRINIDDIRLVVNTVKKIDLDVSVKKLL